MHQKIKEILQMIGLILLGLLLLYLTKNQSGAYAGKHSPGQIEESSKTEEGF